MRPKVYEANEQLNDDYLDEYELLVKESVQRNTQVEPQDKHLIGELLTKATKKRRPLLQRSDSGQGGQSSCVYLFSGSVGHFTPVRMQTLDSFIEALDVDPETGQSLFQVDEEQILRVLRSRKQCGYRHNCYNDLDAARRLHYEAEVRHQRERYRRSWIELLQ